MLLALGSVALVGRGEMQSNRDQDRTQEGAGLCGQDRQRDQDLLRVGWRVQELI